MNAIVEMDKLGRLVVPKKIRDAMHWRAGDSLEMELRNEEVILRPRSRARGLMKKEGLWVYDSGVPLTSGDINKWITEDRERRSRYISGEGLEP